MQKSYYAIIPANVRYDHDIPDGSKLLYWEITALCNERGYCWASNTYFAELYWKSTDTMSRWVSALEKKEYIRSEIDQSAGNQRKIYLVFREPIDENAETLSAKMPIPSPQKHGDPIRKNAVHNNTYNTKNNNTINISLFDFWNSKKIIEHKKMTSTIELAIKRALKDYSQEEIEKAITVYMDVLKSKKTQFSYKWTLDEFLTRKNALPVFLYKKLEDYIFGDTPKVDKIGEIKKTQEIVQKRQEDERSDEESEKRRKLEDARVLRWFESLSDSRKKPIEEEIEKNPLVSALSPIKEEDTEEDRERKTSMLKKGRAMATLYIARKHFYEDHEAMQE